MEEVFSVVFFNLEKKYSIVPTLWLIDISGEYKSYWPGKKQNASSLIRDAASKPDPKWKLYPINLIKKYATYQAAEKKVEKLRNNQSETSEVDEHQHDQVDVPHVPLTFGTPSTEYSEVPMIDAGVLENIISEERFNSIESSVENLRAELKVFQEDSFKKQEQILAELKEVKNYLRQILANVQIGELDPTTLNHSPLPLKTLEELVGLEQYVENQQGYRQLVNELKRIGGRDITKNVYNILRHLVSKDLSKGIRLTDNSGKVSFGGLKLAKAVQEAVIQYWNETSKLVVTNQIITEAIGKFFRNTSERKKKNGDPKNNQVPNDTQSNRRELEENSDSSSIAST